MPQPEQVDLLRQPAPGMDAPARLAFSPDAHALTYLWSANGSNVRQLWWHDLATGERRVMAEPPPTAADETALSAEELLRRQRLHEATLGITDYEWASGSNSLLAIAAGTCLFARDGGIAVPIAGLDHVQAAFLAPEGGRIAFARSGDVYVSSDDGGQPLRLTDDAEPGVFNGLPEYIAAEELDRHTGMWWSADSRALAWAHVDERRVPQFVISHLGGDEPIGEEHRYPFAGGPNARVTLRVARLDDATAEGAAPIHVDLGMADDDYLARVVALPGGGWLVATLPRDQRSLRWLRVSIDGQASVLWVVRGEPWLNLDDQTRPLADGRILRSTEASGFRHLELRSPDGKLERRLTDGDWVVTNVDHVDEARGEVLFTATADGVIHRHLYSVRLDVGRPVRSPERLTVEPGWHEVVVSRDGERWADTWSTREEAPRIVVRGRDGSATVGIHEPSASAASTNLAVPELFEVAAADSTTALQAALFRPRGTAPTSGGGPPPCVVWVYGGPHSQYVKDAWELTILPLRQALVRAGFAVLTVDNRGTSYRGASFESAINRRLGSVEVDDQVAAVKSLVARGDVDGSRIGVTGGSYGGYMTVMSLLRHPDLFRAGVASAPVVDWDGYDTAYTERYIGTPAENRDGYRASSLLASAGDLHGDLLIQHGDLDENVHLRHTGRLLEALQAAGRDADLHLLPGERHLVRSPAALQARLRRAVTHFRVTLGREPSGEEEGQAAS
jgi:dipeptidyl-peptidase-4